MDGILNTGCTVEHNFALPCSRDELAALYVTMNQGYETILEKELKDIKVVDMRGYVTLTEDETLLFDYAKGPVDIQVRGVTNDEIVFKSNVITIDSDILLKGGKINSIQHGSVDNGIIDFIP